MKIKDLIFILEDFNPETEVAICCKLIKGGGVSYVGSGEVSVSIDEECDSDGTVDSIVLHFQQEVK